MPEGLKILKKVDGGGDSLFESLNEILIEEEICSENKTVQDLRRELVEDILENHKDYGIEMDKYKKKNYMAMKNPGVVPYLDVILAFCKKYEVQVWMHGVGSKPLLFDYCKDKSVSDWPRVHLQNLAGVHFNPMSEKKSFRCNVTNLEELRWRNLVEEKSLKEDQELAEDTLERIKDIFCEDLERVDCNHKQFCNEMVVSANGVKGCTIMDTGAEISIISASVWKAMSEDVSKNALISGKGKTDLVGLGPESYQADFMAKVRIEISGYDFGEFPVAVAKDGVLPCCILLGNNFIKQNNIFLDYHRREIKCRLAGKVQVLHRFSVSVV